MKNILLLITFGTLSLIACNKFNEDCPNEFVVYGNVTPYDSVYHVGDTIEIEINFSELIEAYDSKIRHDLSGVHLDAGFHIYKIDSLMVENYSSATEYCNIISHPSENEIVLFTSGNSMLYGHHVVFAGTNNYHVRFITTKPGLYMLTCGIFTFQNRQDFGKCSGEFDLSTILNPNLDNNIQLLKESPNEFFNTWLIADAKRFYYQKSGFAYRVID